MVAADFQTAQPAIMLYARLLFASVLAWERLSSQLLVGWLYSFVEAAAAGGS
jgi:hypothetical protein